MAVCSRVPVFYAAWVYFKATLPERTYLTYIQCTLYIHLLVYDMYLVGRAAVLDMFNALLLHIVRIQSIIFHANV